MLVYPNLTCPQQNNLIVGDIASRDIVKGNELQITILLEQLRAAHKRKLEVSYLDCVKLDSNLEALNGEIIYTIH